MMMMIFLQKGTEMLYVQTTDVRMVLREKLLFLSTTQKRESGTLITGYRGQSQHCWFHSTAHRSTVSLVKSTVKNSVTKLFSGSC
jgi:aspartokinase